MPDIELFYRSRPDNIHVLLEDEDWKFSFYLNREEAVALGDMMRRAVDELDLYKDASDALPDE
jgi:hypothetical protein